MATKLKLPDTRWGAFGGHLLISALIFVALFLLIYLLFFPGALFWVAGGVEGIKIVAGVDVVLGPLLTLVIYNAAKPRRELYRDLSIIGAIQISALAAGMFIVWQSRPVSVTWVYDGFYAAKAGEFARAGMELPGDISPLTPTLYLVRLPENDDEARAILAAVEANAEPLRLRSDLFEPLPDDETDLRYELRGRADGIPLDGSACVPVDITTAFAATEVCFDPLRKRFGR